MTPLPPPPPRVVGFSEAAVIPAEGARVEIRTCDQCGASVLVDPRDDVDRLKAHAKWHADQHKHGHPW